jgi:DNA recombination protein RmuC
MFGQSIDLLYIYIILTAVILLFFTFILLYKRKRPGPSLELLENITTRLNQIEKISEQVDSLTEIFLLPRVRGGIGETLLENLLKTYLPRSLYDLQYSFKNGARVDAVIRTGDRIIPIDAKFPLESVKSLLIHEKPAKMEMRGDIKRVFLKHSREIAEKYIHPTEGTMGFALMYIPSERIYYQAFVEQEQNLLQEVSALNVIPVSPGSTFLYLQTILFGMKGLVFSKKQNEIAQRIASVKKDFRELSRLFKVMGNHVKNLYKSYDESYGKMENVETEINRLDTPD